MVKKSFKVGDLVLAPHSPQLGHGIVQEITDAHEYNTLVCFLGTNMKIFFSPIGLELLNEPTS